MIHSGQRSIPSKTQHKQVYDQYHPLVVWLSVFNTIIQPFRNDAIKIKNFADNIIIISAWNDDLKNVI